MDTIQFTGLLKDWQDGRKEALDELTPVVYQELHRIAAAFLSRERRGNTLQPTALIHEAYLKLVNHDQQEWHSRAHFFSVACHIMRQILAKHARDKHALKRGGGGARVTLDEAVVMAPERGEVFVALDDALTELGKIDARKAKLIELKYFGGLKGEEIAEVLGISVPTVTRDCRHAEAWLQAYLTSPA